VLALILRIGSKRFGNPVPKLQLYSVLSYSSTLISLPDCLTKYLNRHSEVFGATNTIGGLDAVGEIIELGPGVTDFQIGQVVLGISREIGSDALIPVPKEDQH